MKRGLTTIETVIGCLFALIVGSICYYIVVKKDGDFMFYQPHYRVQKEILEELRTK